jgi:hypothetical protein
MNQARKYHGIIIMRKDCIYPAEDSEPDLLHQWSKLEYKKERKYWAEHRKTKAAYTARNSLRDSIFSPEYNPEYGDSYPSRN